MDESDDEILARRVTTRTDVFGGEPIVRDMRISVRLILNLLSQGVTWDALLEDYPRLERDDIRACLIYAARAAATTVPRLASLVSM